MKFAQEFKKVLQDEGFPDKWVQSAIPYGQLKKCLKRVTNELNQIGLGKETLARLANTPTAAHALDAAAGEIAFDYRLDDRQASPSRRFRPRLTVFVHLQDGVAVDAGLTPATRHFLEKVAAASSPESSSDDAASCDAVDPIPSPGSSDTASLEPRQESRASSPPNDSTTTTTSESHHPFVQRVEVPLVFDGEFFDLLQTDVLQLDTLQEEEQAKLRKEIAALGQDIERFTKPQQGMFKSRAELARWRQIFQLYLDARVFFSTHESDHGARTSAQALTQLKWFQDQVTQRRLTHGLRLESSRQAYGRFLNLNAVLLQNLKFQEINKLAITKILKKFDKRTSLGVTKSFPTAVHSERLLAGGIAKEICAQVSSELISVVPQLDDYLCPICFAIAYWPLKLDCQHVFCSRCLVKMARKGERHCPLCRADVVLRAGLDNFDEDMARFLRLYFPKEVKEKIRDNERERHKEIFGSADPIHCIVM